MSNNQSGELPLWIQDRGLVLSHDQGVEWRQGKKPDYSYTNEFLYKEKKFHHPENSLAAIAETLVRTFEMEASHKDMVIRKL